MNNHFDVLTTEISDLLILQHIPIGDNRGYLERLFCAEKLQSFLAGKSIVQINRTYTATRGTVRGMHFQYPPHAEIKFVTCVRGEVFDVAVDLRRNSSTFSRWHGERLNSDTHRTILIPEGFAHGFQSLTSDCELIYFHTAAYRPDSEGGVNPLDPRLGIQWPMTITELSQRDTIHPFLTDDFTGVMP